MRERYLVLFFALFLVSAFSGYTQCLAQEKIGDTEYVSISTPHPYPNGDSIRPVVWSHTITHPGATFIKVHFANMAIEGDIPDGPSDVAEAFSKDYVSILNADGKEVERLTGVGDKWAISVPGDTVIIELHADGQNASYGFDIDQYGWGFRPIVPKQACGVDGKTSICDTLFPDRLALSDAVARLTFQDDCTGDFFTGTGFLFTPEGCFMTNAHNVNSQAECESAEVQFNWQSIDCAFLGRPIPDVFRCRTFLHTDCDLDLSVLEVFDPIKGNPAPIYGNMTLSDRAPVAGEAVWIPQHPLGLPKEISEDGNVTTIPVEGINFCEDPPVCVDTGLTGRNTEFDNNADTDGGSSGSPVLDTNNLVIGLYHAGSCAGTVPEPGVNSAVLMSEILPILLQIGDTDGDGFIAIPCGDDCDDTDPAINPGASEACNDNADNDCDGLVDCTDPDCDTDQACATITTTTTTSTTITTTTTTTSTTTSTITATVVCQCPDDSLGCISGQVTDRNGNPLVNKKVKIKKIKRKGRPRFKTSVRTVDNGCYQFTNLDDGIYKIRVKCKRRRPKREKVTISDGVNQDGRNFTCKK